MNNVQSPTQGGVSGTATAASNAAANGGGPGTNPMGTSPPAGSAPNGMVQNNALPGGFDPGPDRTTPATPTGVQSINSGQSGSGTGTFGNNMVSRYLNNNLPTSNYSGPQTNGKPADCPPGFYRCAAGNCCPEIVSGGPLGPPFASANA